MVVLCARGLAAIGCHGGCPPNATQAPTVTRFVVAAMTNGAATLRLVHEGGPWTL